MPWSCPTFSSVPAHSTPVNGDCRLLVLHLGLQSWTQPPHCKSGSCSRSDIWRRSWSMKPQGFPLCVWVTNLNKAATSTTKKKPKPCFCCFQCYFVVHWAQNILLCKKTTGLTDKRIVWWLGPPTVEAVLKAKWSWWKGKWQLFRYSAFLHKARRQPKGINTFTAVLLMQDVAVSCICIVSPYRWLRRSRDIGKLVSSG